MSSFVHVSKRTSTCAHVYAHVYTHSCAHVYVYMSTFINIYVYVNIYAHVYVYMLYTMCIRMYICTINEYQHTFTRTQSNIERDRQTNTLPHTYVLHAHIVVHHQSYKPRTHTSTHVCARVHACASVRACTRARTHTHTTVRIQTCVRTHKLEGVCTRAF